MSKRTVQRLYATRENSANWNALKILVGIIRIVVGDKFTTKALLCTQYFLYKFGNAM
jgi:hypothetical protein